jgi:glyoxylase-like metal-dependent hydrolase (beta-lactamase superfamily II)
VCVAREAPRVNSKESQVRWCHTIAEREIVSLVVEDSPEVGITRVSRWCFNCYLVAGDDDGLVVVDAGMPGIAADLEPLLARIPRVVKVVTATHGHPDHVGGAAVLAQRHNAQIHLPATTLSYFDGVTPRTPTLMTLARTWPLLFGQPFDAKAALGFGRAALSAGFGTSRGMLWHGVRPVAGLENEMPLPGASAWTVLNCPGHTDDSIAFWNARSGTLLSGDAVITIKGRPRFAPDIVDTEAAAKTSARLRALPVEHLFPGHGSPVHGRSLWAHAEGHL